MDGIEKKAEPTLPDNRPDMEVKPIKTRRQKAYISAFVLALLLIATGIGTKVYINRANQWVRTNNASVDGNIYRVNVRVHGVIEKIEVVEGTFVQEGETLAYINPTLSGIGISRDGMSQEPDDLNYILQQAVVKAPTSGYVAQIQGKEGEQVEAGMPLLAIVNLENVWIRANFSERDIRNIKVGKEVEIRLDAFPDETFAGRVTTILPTSGSVFSLFPPDATAGNWVRVQQRIPVKIAFENRGKYSDMMLRIGMLARVRVKR